MMAARTRAWFPILLLVAACGGRQAVQSGGDRNLLSSDELQRAGFTDGLMAVQSLRPHWLQMRGPTSRRAETIKVYLDGSLLGGPDQLKTITTRSIGSIRYFNGLEASQRWGLDHGQGAIVVNTRKS
jgi:hypothetical protein